MFQHVDRFPGDPILTLVEAFERDSRVNKVNLSIGIYYDDDGKIPVLRSVWSTEVDRFSNPSPRPYLPMEGAANYRTAVQQLLFGEGHEALRTARIATIQTVGGSGALKVGADFLKRYFPESEVWVSSPTWDNHRSIFEGAGFKVNDYPYYDFASGGICFSKMLEKISELPEKSILLLHACCHNPTGVDLTRDQWTQVIEVIRSKQLIPFLDIAYQGFGDGIHEDAWAVRAFADAQIQFLISNSFSKNLSYYGERCGGLSVVCQTIEQAERVLGQLKSMVRRNYSSPPTFGSQVVATVILDQMLRSEWENEVKGMRERIKSVRQTLYQLFTAAMPARDHRYLLTQRGMFSYSGLSPAQVDTLREKYGVYLVRTGRMCISAVNSKNIDYVANAITTVMNKA